MKKLQIRDVVSVKTICAFDEVLFAKTVSFLMPEFEVTLDNCDEQGEYSELFDFDIEFNSGTLPITVIGKVRMHGTLRKILNTHYAQESEVLFEKTMEIETIDFYVFDEPVTMQNEKSLIIEINKWL